MSNDVLMEVRDLRKQYTVSKSLLPAREKHIKVVNGVELTIFKNETLGLVGESGCGKSTLGNILLRLIEPTSGEVFFEGEDIFKVKKKRLRELRKEMQVVFQDPYSSLNPRMTIRDLVQAPLDVFHLGNKEEKTARVLEVLRQVGLGEQHLNRFPHEFSGGQRQRIGIARAIILNPKFIVFDEPVSALDVSVRSQVINLMQDLQASLKLTYLFISHDLSVVKHICDRVAVMYLGEIVEIADKNELYKNPKHPYTQALLSSIPIPDRKVERKPILLKGEIPSVYQLPGGCVFHTRCPFATDQCKTMSAPSVDISPTHRVSCHLYS